MKHILIIAALPGELKVAKSQYQSYKNAHISCDFLCTGIGNINATLSLTEKLQTKKYDFILNIWVCGYKDSKEDIIQISRSFYAPTGKEIITPTFFHIAPLKSIYCSETPVYDSSLLGDENYCDMESYAIEKVSEYFRIPRLLLKVPIDKVWEETINFNHQKALETLDRHLDLGKVLDKTHEYLSKLQHPKGDIESYASHYNLTFSENILFEKYYFRYEALLEKDFEEFFQAHKHLSKKEFFAELSHTLENNSLK